MSTLSTRDLVWNRACFAGADDSKPGDVALAALLVFHGPAMNGGVLHATECLTAQELSAACDGFRYYGFGPIAALILEAKSKIAVGHDLGEYEREFDERYSRHIPDDLALRRAFEADFVANPENYAPVQ